MPDIPVRLGIGGIARRHRDPDRGTRCGDAASGASDDGAAASSSALLGIAAAFVAPNVDAAQIMRFSAIAIAGVLTIGLMWTRCAPTSNRRCRRS